MRIRIRAYHFDADPDSAFYFDANPDPASHFDADPDPPFHGNVDPDPASTLMRIRIRLPKIMRIRIGNTATIDD